MIANKYWGGALSMGTMLNVIYATNYQAVYAYRHRPGCLRL